MSNPVRLPMNTAAMRDLDPAKVRWIFVHTEGSPDGTHGTARSINQYHASPAPKGRGWSGIGYHLVIEKDGSIVAGRPLTKQGAHVEHVNDESVGVCVTGNGDFHPFSPAQHAALVPALAALCRRFKLGADRVLGHREVNMLVEAGRALAVARTPKSCPGAKVSMREIRAAVAAELARGGGGAPPIPPLVAVAGVQPATRISVPEVRA